MIQFKFCEL